MKTIHPNHSVISLFTLILTVRCEEEFIPVPSGDGPEYVVEGYLEAGDDPSPPYLILTKTFDFYGEIGPDQFT